MGPALLTALGHLHNVSDCLVWVSAPHTTFQRVDTWQATELAQMGWVTVPTETSITKPGLSSQVTNIWGVNCQMGDPFFSLPLSPSQIKERNFNSNQSYILWQPELAFIVIRTLYKMWAYITILIENWYLIG